MKGKLMRVLGKYRFSPHVGVGKSLFLWFMVISLIPLGTISYYYYINAYKGMTTILERSLVSASNLRVENVNKYFNSLSGNMETESLDPSRINAFKEAERYYVNKGLKAGDIMTKETDAFDYLDKHYSRILKVHNLDNVYYLNLAGDVVYTLNKDLFTYSNIYSGVYADKKFVRTARLASETGRTLFSDLEWYFNQDSAVYGFFCKNVLDKGNRIGMLVYKTSTEKLDEILMDDAGMGQTGLAYLIGQDLKLRSASRFELPNDILTKELRHKKALEWVNTYEYQHIRLREGIDNAPMEIISTYEGFNGNWVYGIVRDVRSLKKLGVNWGLIEELGHDEVFAYPRSLSEMSKIFMIVTVIVVFIVSLLVTNRFVAPIKKLSAWAKEVAEGKLVSRNIRAPKDEVGEMKDTFNKLVENIRAVSEIAQMIAKGDYSQKVAVRSEDDVLAQSINQVVTSFRGVVTQANTIANGDYSTNITPRSDRDTLGIALSNMTSKLRDSSRELKEQYWLKSGLGKLSTTMSGKTELDVLSDDLMDTLVEYLDAQTGALYLKDKEGDLVLRTKVAMYDVTGSFDRFKMGEGVVGFVAQSGKMKEIKASSEGLPTINDGITNQTPSHVLVAPVVYEAELIGVVLIGNKGYFNDVQKDLFEQSLDPIAVAINAALANTRLKELFGETQEQKEQLQVQQEELRQTNEELEEQTRALKHSEEKLQNQKEELSVIKKKDIMLHFPYHHFTHLIDLLREAAIDPKVKVIKMTLYRVASNSSIMKALINAAKNGKQVTAILELQARFDEEANMYWSQKLADAGVKVIFGVPGLKVHSKLLLIERKEEKSMVTLAGVGTGNFNESSARTFCDNLLLTTQKEIATDVKNIFEFFYRNYKVSTFKQLIVAPFYLRSKVTKLIKDEIKNAKEGKYAEIYLKLNNLSDRDVIDLLYVAFKAGVVLKINVRGMFTMIPNPENLDKGIECIGIIDRYLEHSRIFYFHADGEKKVYISSADMMERNLDRRTEVICPILDKDLKEELITMIDLQWKDNISTRTLDNELHNKYRNTGSKTDIRSQHEFYKYLKEKSEKR
jgi:methyl-accepting chemotaxis protein